MERINPHHSISSSLSKNWKKVQDFSVKVFVSVTVNLDEMHLQRVASCIQVKIKSLVLGTVGNITVFVEFMSF